MARLPPQQVVSFFQQVVSKFESKPSRGLMLLVWMRALLSIHTAYLMSVPDLAKVIRNLYG